MGDPLIFYWILGNNGLDVYTVFLFTWLHVQFTLLVVENFPPPCCSGQYYMGVLPIVTYTNVRKRKYRRGQIDFLGFALAEGLIRGFDNRYPDPSSTN